MTVNNISEKIKKLLALAGSDNENEAKLAAERASTLLIKHNLTTRDDLSVDDMDNNQVLSVSRKGYHISMIQSILQDFFFVSTYTSRSRKDKKTNVHIIGRKDNVEIAHYVFTFLKRSFENLWQEHKKKTKASSSKSYYLGLATGLRNKLKEARESTVEQTGLVLAKDPFLEKLERSLGLVKKSNPRFSLDRSTFASGMDKGRSITIRHGIHKTSNKQYLIG